MASLNPEKLLQLIKLSSGDGKEPNFDFIHPEWPRLPVLSKGARELFGGRQPSFPFITRKWPSGCVSRRLYEASSMQGTTQKEFLKYPFVHLDALREGSKEVHPVMAGTSMALVRFDDADLVPHPFLGQEPVVVNGLVSGGPWLSPAHSEIMGGTSIALMLQGLKVWMISTSLTASILFERNLRDPCQFLSTISKPPRYNGKKTFFVAIQRPGDAIIIPHMFAHTVLTIDIGVPSILVGWECITPADLSIPVKVFDNLAFGARKGLWRKQFLEGGVEQLKTWVMSLPADNDLRKHFEWFVEYYDLSLMPVDPPVERIPRKKQITAQRIKNMSRQKLLPLEVSSPPSS